MIAYEDEAASLYANIDWHIRLDGAPWWYQAQAVDLFGYFTAKHCGCKHFKWAALGTRLLIF